MKQFENDILNEKEISGSCKSDNLITETKQKIEMFRSSSDTSFYAFLQKLHTIFAVILGVGLLLLFLAFLPAEAFEELFGVSSYDSGAVKFGVGFTGLLFGIPAIILSIKLMKKIAKTRENCVAVAQKNHIIVYEGFLEGCTCDLQINSAPKFETFSITFDDIVRVQVEQERCDFKFDNPMMDVLCIYTNQKKHKIWAITNVQTLANNINTLI